jgi:hypothetical protein
MSIAIDRHSTRSGRVRSSVRPRRPGIRGQAIKMEVKRFGYFPQTFVWRGKRYDVHAVEQCRTVSRRWFWDVERHSFRVRCAEGTPGTSSALNGPVEV